jgi:hypothetical protein
MTLTEGEVMELIDVLARQRYGVEGVEFLTAYSDGLAESMFPHCEELIELAEALEGL